MDCLFWSALSKSDALSVIYFVKEISLCESTQLLEVRACANLCHLDSRVFVFGSHCLNHGAQSVFISALVKFAEEVCALVWFQRDAWGRLLPQYYI